MYTTYSKAGTDMNTSCFENVKLQARKRQLLAYLNEHQCARKCRWWAITRQLCYSLSIISYFTYVNQNPYIDLPGATMVTYMMFYCL
jgi:hypothetical protein